MKLSAIQRLTGVEHVAHQRRPQDPPRADQTVPQKNAAPCLSPYTLLLVDRVGIQVRAKRDGGRKDCPPVSSAGRAAPPWPESEGWSGG